MSHSICSIFVHVIFRVKDGCPEIKPEIRGRLGKYLVAVVRNMKGEVISVKCVGDHVHLLLAMPRVLAIATIVYTVKSASSNWIKHEFPGMKMFSWQIGYAAYSVSSSHLNRVKRYIMDQEEHHSDFGVENEFI